MNKVIEADFLPREPGGDFSWPDSTPTSRVNEKRRILIVDNDTNATHLVRILLEKTGQYLVLEENNSTNAHRSARIFRPDLILLDVVMPIRDGGEIAAEIQADPELQSTPSFSSRRSLRRPKPRLVYTSTGIHFLPSQSTFKS